MILKINDLKNVRKNHDSIVYCTGCYDVLQAGHIVFFEQCKEFADALVVGVGKDEVLRELKGTERPINGENERLFLVSYVKIVDYAILNDNELINDIDYNEILEELRPDFMVLPDTELEEAIESTMKLCNKLNIQLKMVSRTMPGFMKSTSTTEIINKLK